MRCSPRPEPWTSPPASTSPSSGSPANQAPRIHLARRSGAGARWSARDLEKPRSGYTDSITTPAAWLASASRSPGSPVSTVPPGSAIATTNASTADPVPALARRYPARRAVRSETTGSTSQVFSKRLMFVSVRAAPEVDSASTTVGTMGGHRFSTLSAAISAAARRVRWLSRLSPPESSTSTNQLARAAARSRIRRAIVAARARSRADGSPTSAVRSST